MLYITEDYSTVELFLTGFAAFGKGGQFVSQTDI